MKFSILPILRPIPGKNSMITLPLGYYVFCEKIKYLTTAHLIYQENHILVLNLQNTHTACQLIKMKRDLTNRRNLVQIKFPVFYSLILGKF